ncbi:MAG: flagellar motor protein MotB [Gluconobacter japonicus]|uniref:flagellar motor protein MotB n=1 Tax=Gluconobacter japonicus TaxID=376620 RepID=UPI0039E8C2C9
MLKAGGKDERKIIIKRFEVVEGGHHGGSWKIAYADFVTAMMAFFLVMWLINATTEEQRRGIANFFNPMAIQQDIPPPAENIIHLVPDPVASSQKPAAIHPGDPAGAHPDNGEPGKDHLLNKDAGDRSTQIVVLHDRQVQPGMPPAAPHGQDAQKGELRRAATEISKALDGAPQLADVRSQVSVSLGDDGLHVEVADSDHQAMFPLGSAVPTRHASDLLKLIAPYLEKLPGRLSVSGYTDAAPYRPGLPGNWSLSSDRAVAARDILVNSGFPDRRLKAVTGYADRNLFDPANPLSARNRRVILVLSPDQP